jgi:hypothetical protein
MEWLAQLRQWNGSSRSVRGCSSAFRWVFDPDPTRDYPSLDPDQLALDQLRFVRFAVKPTNQRLFSGKHGLWSSCYHAGQNRKAAPLNFGDFAQFGEYTLLTTEERTFLLPPCARKLFWKDYFL